MSSSSKISHLYDIRDGCLEDANFVMATFLRGVYYGCSWFNFVPKPLFMGAYKKFLTKLLSSDIVVVKVACLKEDPSVILGYSVLSADYQTIHFVFVKKVWRKQGIARSLLPQYPLYVTHLTDTGKQLLTKFDGCVFYPFIF